MTLIKWFLIIIAVFFSGVVLSGMEHSHANSFIGSLIGVGIAYIANKIAKMEDKL